MCAHVSMRMFSFVHLKAVHHFPTEKHKGGAWSPGGVSTGERLLQHPEKLISLSELKIKIKIQSVIIISVK